MNIKKMLIVKGREKFPEHNNWDALMKKKVKQTIKSIIT